MSPGKGCFDVVEQGDRMPPRLRNGPNYWGPLSLKDQLLGPHEHMSPCSLVLCRPSIASLSLMRISCATDTGFASKEE
jgi:hypothetical protein